MARRNDHSREEIREMSLAAAEAILAREGAHALSVRRIAACIGYTHGTLYLVFENLDALITELNGRTLDALAAALERAAAASGPGEPRLHALARAYLAFARRNGARFRLVFEHHLPPGAPPPEGLARRVGRSFALLERCLEEAGAPGRDTPALGAALWCAIHGATVLTLDGKLVDRDGRDLDPQPVLARCVARFCQPAAPR